MKVNVGNKYGIIDKIIAIELYIYIIFMFLTKGEAVRNILLFSSFFLWLTTLKHRENKWILEKPIPLLFWGFIATILISVIFSIDLLYSFKSLRGYPLKSIIIFCLVSTTFSDERRLRIFVYLSFLILLFTLSVGYYSYWAYDLPLMKPSMSIRHSWHAQFAVDINTLLPFTFILLISVRDMKFKVVIYITIITSILAIILSTSRGGLAGFISIVTIWLIYFLKNKRLNVKFIMASFTIVAMLFSISLILSPMMKEKFIRNKDNIMSLGERTEIWGPLISASFNRPVFGWGYGPRIFTFDEPFKKTPYKVAPVIHKPAFRDPHNPFLRVLFHQGIVGLVFYAALMIMATRTFWKGINNLNRFRDLVLLACASILIGTYIVNAIVENSELTALTFILAIGLAARYMRSENSHN